MPHPWLAIQDIACGYDERLTHRKCIGCHRARPETCQSQLEALASLGDAAKAQRSEWR
jgi:hypothetical protein